MTRRFPLLARGLVLVFALALGAAGLGHRFASAADLERAQFAQLFGAGFCQTGDTDAPSLSVDCPVCHLVASVYLPDAVTGAAQPAFTVGALSFETAQPQVRAATTPVSPPPRGPPLV